VVCCSLEAGYTTGEEGRNRTSGRHDIDSSLNSAPPLEFMKVNLDVALLKNSCIVTMAVVARDEARYFQGASVIVM
jgi:hypothetical protein